MTGFYTIFWGIILSLAAFYSARKIGYSGLLWFIASFFYWPLACLYILAALPNKKLDKRRREEMILLQEQLAKKRRLENPSSSSIPQHTISDEKTII